LMVVCWTFILPVVIALIILILSIIVAFDISPINPLVYLISAHPLPATAFSFTETRPALAEVEKEKAVFLSLAFYDRSILFLSFLHIFF
jgi:uncharacterized protein YpmS